MKAAGPLCTRRTRTRALTLASQGQDFGQTDVRAADFLINGRKLYLAAADAGQTLRLWSYEQHAQSWGGKRLLPLCAPTSPLGALAFVCLGTLMSD